MEQTRADAHFYALIAAFFLLHLAYFMVSESTFSFIENHIYQKKQHYVEADEKIRVYVEKYRAKKTVYYFEIYNDGSYLGDIFCGSTMIKFCREWSNNQYGFKVENLAYESRVNDSGEVKSVRVKYFDLINNDKYKIINNREFFSPSFSTIIGKLVMSLIFALSVNFSILIYWYKIFQERQVNKYKYDYLIIYGSPLLMFGYFIKCIFDIYSFVL
ncbi:hypothetical protein GPS59_09035 [Acinetobacter haemolyticus]|uniref:hypothetical protein n=1 Tax=Acinetobacter haemolyticus TaxID=29430 RepID=UPI001331E131|nr:hypothetical protein [Acinetobacter haemolyticus]NAR54151.1 hypothetical protein [Acinetobacter haemolyticus]QHI23511.1 hypothetical protein Ahae5227_11825 [Acinetobacter haemolyticus]